MRDSCVLPCCVLALNLVLGVVSYRMGREEGPLRRAAAIMATVLMGGAAAGWATGAPPLPEQALE